jgi:hypothetical protein
VGSDWETLKRFNLNEIYMPTPKQGGIVGSATEDPTAPLAPDLASADETHVAKNSTEAFTEGKS